MVDEICFSEVLLESAKEVFEAMVFLPLDRASESDRKIEGCPLLGSITFKGTIDGCLAICCSSSCAKHIMTNMLGMDPAGEVAEDEVFDVIGEVVDTIMRGVKSRIFKETGNLEVSTPSVVNGWELENSLGEGATKLSIEVNIDTEYPARLTLLYRLGSPGTNETNRRQDNSCSEVSTVRDNIAESWQL